MSDIEKERALDDLLEALNKRSQTAQQRKKEGWWPWIVGTGIALAVVFGVWLAYYLIKRRGKELALARTQLEQQKVSIEQKKHEAAHEQLAFKKTILEKEITKLSTDIRDQSLKLKLMDVAQEKRVKQIQALNEWKDINTI